MPLSDAGNDWNKKSLEEAAIKRRFIREAVEAGFTEKEAEFFYLWADVDKFVRNQNIVDILKRPID